LFTFKVFIKNTILEIHYFDSPLGTIKVRGDVEGVQEVLFSKSTLEMENNVPNTLVPCVEQLQQYFAGKRIVFDFKTNPQGTDFQKTIWVLLQELPFGSTISYLKLSRQYGNTKAVRSVAAAIGKNPILVAIPCHRVIGSDGTLVGYSGGLERKESLLELEGFPVQKKLI
jgi:methylated-DNA-[protein]-cysteine S-methyltransferase